MYSNTLYSGIHIVQHSLLFVATMSMFSCRFYSRATQPFEHTEYGGIRTTLLRLHLVDLIVFICRRLKEQNKVWSAVAPQA